MCASSAGLPGPTCREAGGREIAGRQWHRALENHVLAPRPKCGVTDETHFPGQGQPDRRVLVLIELLKLHV